MKFYIITTILLLIFLQTNAVSLMRTRLNNGQEDEKKVMRFLSDSFSDYFRLAVFENILNSVGHNLFKIVDSNSNGVLEQGEFQYTLTLLGAPQNVAILLFTISDADATGFLDFGEYLVALEIFVRKALGTVSYNILETNGLEGDLASLTELWSDITSYYKVDKGIDSAAYEEIFNSVDIDKNGVLNLAEFTRFSSALAVKIKRRLRDELDKKITSIAGICASNDFVAKAEEHYQNVKIQAPQATDAEEIIAKILTRATISAGNSEFADWSLSGGEGCDNPQDVAPVSFVALQERSWSTLENGLATGAGGLGFGLFDTMRNFLQMNRPASQDISDYNVLLARNNRL